MRFGHNHQKEVFELRGNLRQVVFAYADPLVIGNDLGLVHMRMEWNNKESFHSVVGIPSVII